MVMYGPVIKNSKSHLRVELGLNLGCTSGSNLLLLQNLGGCDDASSCGGPVTPMRDLSPEVLGLA